MASLDQTLLHNDGGDSTEWCQKIALKPWVSDQAFKKENIRNCMQGQSAYTMRHTTRQHPSSTRCESFAREDRVERQSFGKGESVSEVSC